ncbi:hypothetical protein CDL15_Pgr029100 [Punica granatum]|uniref:Uncharacterized protein n=1 Tax=Punica granatum TaxID=22663 RepID=A0A218XL17_PUNGR|nr:hypothetical protein CDL15_Pgr029100 [Punica granatum]
MNLGSVYPLYYGTNFKVQQESLSSFQILDRPHSDSVIAGTPVRTFTMEPADIRILHNPFASQTNAENISTAIAFAGSDFRGTKPKIKYNHGKQFSSGKKRPQVRWRERERERSGKEYLELEVELQRGSLEPESPDGGKAEQGRAVEKEDENHERNGERKGRGQRVGVGIGVEVAQKGRGQRSRSCELRKGRGQSRGSGPLGSRSNEIRVWTLEDLEATKV